MMKKGYSGVQKLDPKIKTQITFEAHKLIHLKTQRGVKAQGSVLSDEEKNLVSFQKLATWCPHEPSYEQINPGYPHHNPRVRAQSGYRRLIDCLGTAQVNTLVSAQVIGSGLCMTAMSAGEVSFFHFTTGRHVYSLNTHVVYKYPAELIASCVDMCVKTEHFLVEQKAKRRHKHHDHDHDHEHQHHSGGSNRQVSFSCAK